MKKLFAFAAAAALTLSLASCANTAVKPSETPKTDAVTTASVTTGKYTNLDKDALLEAIAAYSGVSVVATVNADGTPNNAIFTPGAINGYIVFGLADNATKQNLLRDKQAVMVFDSPNTAAETKEGRHSGAVVELKVVDDSKVLDELKAANERVTDASIVCEIVEVRDVG